MNNKSLYIVMVGLPARGKSTIARKLKENLARDHIKTRIFNNGDLRRKLVNEDTSSPEFYNPKNSYGLAVREQIAVKNINRAKSFINGGGQVAILDATNVSLKRREKIVQLIPNQPLLFIECTNDDEEILKASIEKKVAFPEFNHLSRVVAIQSFHERINYYCGIYTSLKNESNFIKLNSLYNKISKEEITDEIPYYDRIRDFLVTDTIKNLFLIRHGETYFNLQNRIGGNSSLTENGKTQAETLARFFQKRKIPYIFTSQKKRTIQTAAPIKELQENCDIIPLDEFNEIDSGVCECMSYEEIREKIPQVYMARKKNKYSYIYPEGEGYVSMKERVDRGIKKAIYLSANSENIMIIGHRAANRMILSHFLFRRKEDVPYIYVPQDKFYHIAATQYKKIFQLKPYGI
jgi:broad specificity phosphatase PhoE/predicted kinase